MIQHIIHGALIRLKGKILDIKAEEILTKDGKPDEDHNYRIQIKLVSGNTEKASIFALNNKSEPKAIEELVEKIEKHLANREKPGVIMLSSGAIVLSSPNAQIQEVDGYLAVEEKISVLPAKDQYMPIPGAFIQSYTNFDVFREDDLIIMKDDYDDLRHDGKEGMIFNTKKPLSLTKDQLKIHPKDENADHLPEKGEYLLIFRKRSDAMA